MNNAGVIRDGLFVRMEPADWQTVIDTNLTGTYAFCRAVAGQMALKQRSGRIINISSVAAEPDYESAVITWTTSEPSDSLVQFGASILPRVV